ncbi:Hypothetical protein LUCI_1934 [Lucifera butyrica]|uniref:Uncharacterized protein n=1 Tax=Lucifera butyrica TaxID=1351585 RepID=A0A498RC23_9FIRM|nr:hypothetical protein [Lucifera butyrica]VBB06698.1 Hypothetical protein LUCI_1934 [Lucifera butyrica]
MSNRPFRISIRFCGGCNPRIDRRRIAAEMKDCLVKSGYVVIYNSLNADFIIYLSGCTANCARRYSGSSTPAAVIAANTLDAVVVAEEQLGMQAIKKVRDSIGKLEKPLSS